MLHLLLVLAALILFLLASVPTIPQGRVNLIALGLACYIASLLAP